MDKNHIYKSIAFAILNEKFLAMSDQLNDIKRFVEEYELTLDKDEIAELKETLGNHIQWLETRLIRPSGTA